jgi:hypothetical protein
VNKLLDQKWFSPEALIEEIRGRLGMSVLKNTLAAWRSRGWGPAYMKLSGRVVAYGQEDVEAWLQNLRAGSLSRQVPSTPARGGTPTPKTATSGKTGVERFYAAQGLPVPTRQHRVGGHITTAQRAEMNREKGTGRE